MAADRTQLEHDLRFRDHHSFEAMRPRASQINEVTNKREDERPASTGEVAGIGLSQATSQPPKCS
jgi:hypothetical protein